MKDFMLPAVLWELYDWAEEQIKAFNREEKLEVDRDMRRVWSGKKRAYIEIKIKMETLFPWLEKSPNSKENRGHGL